MRKGNCKIVSLLISLMFTLSLLFAATFVVFPQTDDSGKPQGPKTTKPPKSGGKTAGKKPNPGNNQKNGGKQKEFTKAVRVTLVLSEPEAEVFLTDSDGNNVFDADVEISPAAGTPFDLGTLAKGTYDLTVRKLGYHDEQRTIKVQGQPINLKINLRPSAGFLTLTGNLEDATIEIGGIGTFSGPISSQIVPPGSYQIKVSKKGYLAHIETADINVGEECSINFNLRRIPVESMLAEAEAALLDEQFDRAADLCSSVLDVEPKNSKANHIMGKILFQRGQRGAAQFYIKAIDGRENVVFLVKIFSRDKSKKFQLIEGKLVIDQYYLEVTSVSRPDLNFSIFKPEVTDLQNSRDDYGISLVTFRGKGSVNNKQSSQRVTLYSTSAYITSDRSRIFCAENRGGSLRCGAEVDILYDVIKSWQNPSR